jgi:hypothetical protein
LKRLFVTRLRKILVTALVIIAALSVVAYAYWRSLPSQTGPIVTLTSPPFELSFMLDKTAYSFDDNMTIAFYLRNISNETVSVGKPSMGGLEGVVTSAEGVTIVMAEPRLLNIQFHFGYVLAAANGTVIARNLYGPLQQVYGLVFEPNASLNQTVSFEIARFTDQCGSPLQKGTYQISGAFLGSVIGVSLYTRETPSIAFTLGANMRGASLPSPAGPKVTLTSSPLELSMSLDKTAYPLDDNMSISFYLRNISNRTITVFKSSMEGGGGVTTTAEGVTIPNQPQLLNLLFHFGYIFYAGNGTEIYRNLNGPMRSIYWLDFEPNASLNQTLYVQIATYFGTHEQPLQKGAYQLRAALKVGVNSTDQVYEQYLWETPSIAFTIG